MHNELTLRADDVAIQAVGVKLTVGPDGVADVPQQTGRMRQIAQELCVPFLEFSEKCPLGDLPANVPRDEAGNLLRGRGFVFQNHWNYKYYHVMDLEYISPADNQRLRPLLASAFPSDEAGRGFLQRTDEQVAEEYPTVSRGA